MDSVPSEEKVFSVDTYGRSKTTIKESMSNVFAQFGESMTDYSAGLSTAGDFGKRISKGTGKGLVIGFANLGDGILAPLNEATGGSLTLLDQYIDSKPIQTYMRKILPEEDLGTAGTIASDFTSYLPGYLPGFQLAGVYTKSIFLKSLAASVLAPWFYGESENPNIATVVNMLTGASEEQNKTIVESIVDWADSGQEADTFDAKIKTVVSDAPFEASFVVLLKGLAQTYKYFKSNPAIAKQVATAYNMMDGDVMVEDAFGNRYGSDGKLISLGTDPETNQGESD